MIVLAVVFALLVAAGSALIVAKASAAWTEVAETGRAGYLSLRSDPGLPAWSDLRPGDTEHWLIEVSLDDADDATLRIELHAAGELIGAGGMTVSVTGCSSEFVIGAAAPHCEAQAEAVLPETSLAAVAAGEDVQTYPLADLRRGAPRYVLVTLGVAASASPDAMAGASARIGVGLHAEGEAPDEPGLASTGADMGDLVPVIMLATGMLGLGLSAALWRRVPRRSDREHA
ncbi:hypothetical protein [Microbacterium tumbae]